MLGHIYIFIIFYSHLILVSISLRLLALEPGVVTGAASGSLKQVVFHHLPVSSL